MSTYAIPIIVKSGRTMLLVAVDNRRIAKLQDCERVARARVFGINKLSDPGSD